MISRYYVRVEGFDKIKRDFDGMDGKSKKILKAAINDTAKKLRKDMTHGANKRYKFKEGLQGYLRATTIKKATVGKPEAEIKAVGPMQDLKDYQVNPDTYFPGSKGAPSWIKGKVLRKSSLKGVARRKSSKGDKYKGFIVRFSNGHKAMVSRRPGSVSRSNPNKEVIEVNYSPTIPKGEEVVYRDELQKDVQALLQKNIMQQVHRFLG